MSASIKHIIFTLACLFSFNAKAQLIADFTASDTAFCAPGAISFKNLSIGATSYSWDFGNGTPLSTATDPSTTYLSVGTYTVTLTAKNGSTTATKSLVLRAYGPPTISFNLSTINACVKSPVTFTSTSTANMWGPLEYTWNFGDGASSTLATATYSYVNPAFYNITLYAKNKGKCVASLTKPTYLHVLTPVKMDFDAPVTHFCKAPATVSFATKTSGTGPITYQWFFGDGATSTLPNPAHTYTAPGDYTVKLIATDGNGCMDSLTQSSFVGISDLKATFSSKLLECYNTDIKFFDTTRSPHISRTWNFGDGTKGIHDTEYHNFAGEGVYNVTMSVFDGFCYDSVTKPVRISEPKGSFTVFQPCLPESQIDLTATTATPSINVTWDFGDLPTHSTGSGYTISHQYADNIYLPTGKTNGHPPHDIIMTLTDTLGCVSNVQIHDTVFNIAYLFDDIKATTTRERGGCVPLTVNFDIKLKTLTMDLLSSPTRIIDVPYPHAVASYFWDFGDGSASSSAAKPTHIYTAVGIYNVHVIMRTVNGCVVDTVTEIKVGSKQTATYTRTPGHICRGQTITYTSATTSTLIDDYEWLFYDGGSDKGPSKTSTKYEPQITGIFSPELYVYYNGCKSDAYSIPDTIDSPTAFIKYNFLCIPFNGVSFVDNSLGDDDLLWDFGDGITSTVKNQRHYFDSAKIYKIVLSTHNNRSGCRDTAEVLVNMRRLSATSTIESHRPNICRDEEDTVTAIINNITVGAAIFTLPLTNYWYDNWTSTDTTTPYYPNEFNPTLMQDSIDHFYPVKGDHLISLVMLNNHGCLDTLYDTMIVAKPVTKFSSTFANGCAPVVATFVDSSKTVNGAPVKLHRWNFGDITVFYDTIASAIHNYDSNGTFVIQEIAIDTFGCTDTAYSSVSPIVHKPQANFSVSDSVVCLRSSFHFRNTSAVLGSGTYLWSFGDGATSTAFQPDHTYTTPGTYSVSLVAIDPAGCFDTLVKTNYLQVNPIPTAIFTMSDSFAICPPLNVTFSNFSTNAVAFDWNLGDGSFSQTPNPNDIYSLPGLYTIRLVASDVNGCIDTAIGHVSIFGYKGAFSYTPVSVCNGAPVLFRSSITGATSMIWDFNDGSTYSPSTIVDTVTHVYTTPGAYLPRLLLKDAAGCSRVSDGADSIKVDTLIPNFYFTPLTACQNSSITFHDSSYSLFSGSATWAWAFGSGATSTVKNPAYTFSVSGTQSVSLSVTDSAGCSSFITKTINIQSGPVLIAGAPVVCEGRTILLSDATTGGRWSSSNTNVATVDTGLVTGRVQGSATITYTLSNGCNTTATATVNPAPLSITGTAGVCVGATTKLTDATAAGSWTSSNTAIASIGSTGIVAGISAGTLTISYTIASGCAATKVVTVYPLPSVITGVDHVCKGLAAQLSDSVAGGTWASSIAFVGIGSASGIATGAAQGTATITYRLPTGCLVTRVQTVDPLPNNITGIFAACVSATAALSDNGSPGGKWASSDTVTAVIDSTTGIFTGRAAGTATISYTLPTGCATVKNVTINPLPATITGQSNVCVSATITLSDSVSGGTWASSNTSVATISTARVVAGKAPGTATITYKLATGCLATKIITVNPLPSAISGNVPLCAGSNATLSNSLPGGSWSSSNTGVATIGNISGACIGISAGTATISYTPAAGAGCIAVTTVTVMVQPSAIKGTLSVCNGLSTALSDSVTGGLWSSSATVLSVGAASGIVKGIAPGSGIATYTLGSCTVTASVIVDPLPAAVTAPSLAVCAGLTITLSDADAGGSWSSSATILSVGSSSGIVNGVSTGTATVTYMLSSGCIATTNVTVNPLPAPITGKDSVCKDLKILLSDASTGGTWTSANVSVATIGSVSGIATGVSAGTTAITYSLPTGCITAAVLRVNPTPATIAAATFSVCPGLNITLSDADAGGIWTSTNTSVATIGSASGIVAGISPGTANIYYTLPTGCTINTMVQTYPFPAAISGPSRVCEGLTIPLSDASGAGSWISDATTVATIGSTSGIVTGIIKGTTTITYTLAANGCFMTTTVTVDPTPATITGGTDVCEGAVLLLSDPDRGGSWTTSSTAITIGSITGIVTGITATTALVTYTLPTTCLITAIITVDPQPGPITGIVNICLGATTALSDPGSNGGSWSAAGTVVIIDPVTGTATGIAPGTSIISYTMPGGCFATTIITINDTPSNIVGRSFVCQNDTTMLSDSLPGGLWFSTDESIVFIDPSGIIKGIRPGTATISYTTRGGCTTSRTITVYPIAAPITGPSAVCKGASISLSDSVTGGTWASSDSDVARISSSGTLSGLQPGTTRISYTMPHGCRSAAINVTVNPLPYAGIIKGPDLVCTGSSIQLSDSVVGGVWTLTNDSLATIYARGLLTGINGGIDTVRYTYTNSCGTDIALFTVTINPAPDYLRITTHPEKELCGNTLMRNFGAGAPPKPGIQYLWSATNAVIYATGTDKQYCLVNFPDAGTSVIRLVAISGSNTACTRYDSIIYNISATPTQYPSVVYYTPEFVCEQNTSRSFQWGYDDVATLDSTILTGMVNQNYYEPNPDFVHKYYWVITQIDGCYSKSYYNRPTAISAINADNIEITLYPNPADDRITATVKGIGNTDVIEARITDMIGREKKTCSLIKGTATIQLNAITPGVYMISFSRNGISIGTRKLVKE